MGLRQTSKATALAFIAAIGACGSPNEKNNAPPAVKIGSKMGGVSATPSPKPAPTPRYDQEDRGTYYYVGAVSDEDKAKGRAAGDVYGFRYFGKSKENENIIGSVSDKGIILFKSYCSDPCKIIRHNGKRIGFSDESIIGAAFVDAMNGLLKPYGKSEDSSAEFPQTASTVPKSFRGAWDEIISDGCKGRESRFLIDGSKFYNFEVEYSVTGVKLYSSTEADIFTTYIDEKGAQQNEVWGFRLTDGGKTLTSRKASDTFFRRCPAS